MREQLQRVVTAAACIAVGIAAIQQLRPRTIESVAGTYVANFDSAETLVLSPDGTYREIDANLVVTTGSFTVDHGERLALRRPSGGFLVPRIGPRLFRMCISVDPDSNEYLCRRFRD